MKRLLLLIVPALALTIGLLNPARSTNPPEIDSDADSLPDDFEIFYGLDPVDPSDAWLDYDGDGLSNLEESRKLTDPFSADTDFDGFQDNFDSVISRAFLPFGVELFTHGDFCEYARPDFCLGARKTAGEWFYMPEGSGATNQNRWRGFLSGWFVSSSETNHASLSVALDRSILTNNLIYALHYSDNSNASLFVDLLDTNGLVIAENLFGNLLTSSNAEAVVLLEVPTAIFSDAALIQLRRGTGEVIVYEGLVYIDEDGDGLDADQERQLGTSDYSIDSNGNGISDYAEWLDSTSGGSSTNNPDDGSGGEGDGGGGDSEDDHGSHTRQGIIYVDQAIGDDTLTGYSAEISGNEGPKKTVRAGLSVAQTNDMLIIKSGDYNENLNIQGKDVRVWIEGKVRL